MTFSTQCRYSLSGVFVVTAIALFSFETDYDIESIFYDRSNDTLFNVIVKCFTLSTIYVSAFSPGISRQSSKTLFFDQKWVVFLKEEKEQREIDYKTNIKRGLFALPRRPLSKSRLIGNDDGYNNDLVGEKDLPSRQASNTVGSLSTSSGISNSSMTSLLNLYSLDPYSPEAIQICRTTLKLSEKQVDQVQTLCSAIVKWNERINLVSRVDCSVSTVFGRHVLPSLATLADSQIHAFMTKSSKKGGPVRVIDVGTGGGFPGLPLAIAYPNAQFVLMDSIGKKLIAVNDIANNQLGLKNVQTLNQRSEEYNGKSKFDVVTGRSVTAIPQFCSWIHSNILDPNHGHMIYWIGGEIDHFVNERVTYKNYVNKIYSKHNVTSDKQILVIPYNHVQELGREYTRQQSTILPKSEPRRAVTTKSGRQSSLRAPGNNGRFESESKPRKKLAKGEWKKKNRSSENGINDNDSYGGKDSLADSRRRPQQSSILQQKQTGSNSFQRFKSSPSI